MYVCSSDSPGVFVGLPLFYADVNCEYGPNKTIYLCAPCTLISMHEQVYNVT